MVANRIAIESYATGLDPNGELSADQLAAAHARYCELLTDALDAAFTNTAIEVAPFDGDGIDHVTIYDEDDSIAVDDDVMATVNDIRTDVFNRAPWLAAAFA